MMIYQYTRKLVADTCGSTGIEYALIGSLVSIAILIAVFQLGGELASLFQTITDRFNAAVYG